MIDGSLTIDQMIAHIKESEEWGWTKNHRGKQRYCVACTVTADMCNEVTMICVPSNKWEACDQLERFARNDFGDMLPQFNKVYFKVGFVFDTAQDRVVLKLGRA